VLSVSPLDVHHLQRNSRVTLIDVRGREEFDAVHASGAVNVPLNELMMPGRLAVLAPEGPTYVICKSGARSQMAIRALGNLGFSGLHNVVGGTDAWAAAGLPIAGTVGLTRR
jgi:rhodanese-related sulfurtransferase